MKLKYIAVIVSLLTLPLHADTTQEKATKAGGAVIGVAGYGIYTVITPSKTNK